MDNLPPPTPSNPAPALPPARGGCCCAGGCVTLLTVSFIGFTLFLAATWYFGAKLVSNYTSTAPTTIRMDAPSEPQFTAATAKLEQMRAAALQNQAGTFEFTADDLNALIARHPAFSELRNKVRVAIQGENMLVDASVPLSTVSLPGFSRRYFNGAAKFGLDYDDGSFDFALRSLTANGREIPLSVLPALNTTFSETFNTGFKKSQRDNRANEEVWEHIKTMSIIDNKLVVITQPISSQ